VCGCGSVRHHNDLARFGRARPVAKKKSIRAAESDPGEQARYEKTQQKLSAHSPEFNPIEECVSKIKESLRAAKGQTKRKLLNALRKAIKKATIPDICGRFAHFGHTFSLN
jgi:hypothetical protein